MAEQNRPEESQAEAEVRGAVLRRRPATGSEVRDRARQARDVLSTELEAVAARAAADLRGSFADFGGQLGFLDDVVDLVDDAVDVTEEIINHIAMNTEEITAWTEEITPEITPVTVITIGLIRPADGDGLPTGRGQREASAAQLLEARLRVLEARDSISERLRLVVHAMRAQLSAPRADDA